MKFNRSNTLVPPVLALCALLLTTIVADAQEIGNRKAAEDALPIFLYCENDSQVNLTRLAELGDAAALYAMGIEAFFGKCVPEDRKMAMLYLSKSASTRYPPAMHWLATLLKDEEPKQTQKIFTLYRDSALLGYRRSEFDVAIYYADQNSKVHSNPDAYAWIHLCLAHDRICAGFFDEFLSHLSPADREKGKKIQDELFEKMRNVRPVTDVYRFPSSWAEPKG